MKKKLNAFWLIVKGLASDWLYVVPWGMRKLLNWIKDNYGNPPVYITENGTSDANGMLNDQHRVDYHRQYISQVLKGYQQTIIISVVLHIRFALDANIPQLEL